MAYLKIIGIEDETVKTNRRIKGWLVIDDSGGYRITYDDGCELRSGEKLKSGNVLPPEVDDD